LQAVPKFLGGGYPFGVGLRQAVEDESEAAALGVKSAAFPVFRLLAARRRTESWRKGYSWMIGVLAMNLSTDSSCVSAT